VSAVILASTGSVFSSGHDLRELVHGEEPGYREVFDLCCQLMLKIQALSQPVIAEVQGMATAAGCQLVATCDLAVASDTATFATPGVRIGLFCSTPMVALSRAVGRKRALEMLLTGLAIDARTAAEWGLINHVVPAAELRGRALSLASRIASASHFTVETGKHAFYRQIDLDTAGAYALTKEVMTENALAADAQEGISAFLEKRQPCWKGR
jgi:enoyl-CoA hydratase/carnithine racemase